MEFFDTRKKMFTVGLISISLNLFGKSDSNTFIHVQSDSKWDMAIYSKTFDESGGWLSFVNEKSDKVELTLQYPELVELNYSEKSIEFIIHPNDSLSFTIVNGNLDVAGRGSGSVKLFLGEKNETILNRIPAERYHLYEQFELIRNTYDLFKNQAANVLNDPAANLDTLVLRYKDFDSLFSALNTYPINITLYGNSITSFLPYIFARKQELELGKARSYYPSLTNFAQCIQSIKSMPVVAEKKGSMLASIIINELNEKPQYVDTIAIAYDSLQGQELGLNLHIEKIIGMTRSLLSGKKVLEMPASNLLGESFGLKRYAEKLILIDFWATWCGPCIKQKPVFAQKKEQFSGKVKFISVSVDSDFSRYQNFVRKKTSDIEDSYILSADGSAAFKEEFDIRGIPKYMLFSNDLHLINPNFSNPISPKFDDLLEKELAKLSN